LLHCFAQSTEVKIAPQNFPRFSRGTKMILGSSINQQMENSSWVRRMFEEGPRLKAERGEENVYDFSLGNPSEDPPPEVMAAFRKLAQENRPGSHAYMPNVGFPAVREILAKRLKRDTGLAFTKDHILMTTGAAGAMNVVFKAMLDPGDEVVVPSPYFPEYLFYIGNSGGHLVPAETDSEFMLDVDAIRAAITPRTRAIILNSPNNPTGAIYSDFSLRQLEDMLQKLDHPVVVISDEPYKSFVFDDARIPEIASIITNCITSYSWSKTWALAGERIGYLAISPRLPESRILWNACAFTNRTLGFVNAPAIWQWVVAEAPEAQPPLAIYKEKRNRLCNGLARAGYEVRKPQGAFYVFLKTPIPDDIAFVRILLNEGIMVVPGIGFGRGGYVRLSLTVPLDTIERSLPGFAKALESCR
jgi:aspartate aminotransferase